MKCDFALHLFSKNNAAREEKAKKHSYGSITMNRRRTSSVSATIDVTIDEAKESWENTKKSLKRLTNNNIFMLNLTSACATIFIFSGFGTFLPKFYQVRKECIFACVCSRAHHFCVADMVSLPCFDFKCGYGRSYHWPNCGHVCGRLCPL